MSDFLALGRPAACWRGGGENGAAARRGVGVAVKVELLFCSSVLPTVLEMFVGCLCLTKPGYAIAHAPGQRRRRPGRRRRGLRGDGPGRGRRREGDGVDGPVGPDGWKGGREGGRGKAAGRPSLLGRSS